MDRTTHADLSWLLTSFTAADARAAYAQVDSLSRPEITRKLAARSTEVVLWDDPDVLPNPLFRAFCERGADGYQRRRDPNSTMAYEVTDIERRRAAGVRLSPVPTAIARKGPVGHQDAPRTPQVPEDGSEDAPAQGTGKSAAATARERWKIEQDQEWVRLRDLGLTLPETFGEYKKEKSRREAKAILEIEQSGAELEPTRKRMSARLLSRDQLDQLDQIQPQTPLISGGILDTATIVVLSGKFGTYKSFLSGTWACSIATGRNWEGHEVITPGAVIYVAAEGAAGLNKRIRAWEIGVNDGVRIPGHQLYVYNGRVKLNVETDVQVLTKMITDVGAVLVVIDTMHRNLPGAEENSNSEMAYDAASEIIESTGACVLFNHHTGHAGERARGASSIEDDADAAWVIKFDGGSEDRSPDNQRTLTHRKAKDRELLGEMPLQLVRVPEADSAYVTLDPSTGVLGHLEKVMEIVNKLDELKIPNDWGRDRVKKRLREFGLGYGDHPLTEAIKLRKEGFGK